MQRLRYALVSVLVLAVLACGGGSGEKSMEEKYPGLVPLTDRDPALPGPNYRAVFSVTGFCEEEGQPRKAVVGECNLYTEGPSPTSPVHGLAGVSYRKDWDLDVEGTRIVQSEAEYLYPDYDGSIWSLGGRLPDGTDYFWYSVHYTNEELNPPQARTLLYQPVLEEGKIFFHQASAQRADGTRLFTESGEVEYLGEWPQTTGIGWHEAYTVVRMQSRTYESGPLRHENVVYGYRPDKNILAHEMTWQKRIGIGDQYTFSLSLTLRSLQR